MHIRKDNNLYINMIDGRDDTFSLEMFTGTFHFITEYLNNGRSVLIHCNEARTRSPAIALTYLTFERDLFSKKDYRKARNEFYKIYKNYENCNSGIEIFLRNNWYKFNN